MKKHDTIGMICFAVAVVAMVALLIAIVVEDFDGITPSDFYVRRDRVKADTKADPIKESIRPVAANAIPDGWKLLEDFVAIFWDYTGSCNCNYWMLLENESSGEQIVIPMYFPYNGDAVTYYRFLVGELPQAPSNLQLNINTGGDGEVQYHLYIVNEEGLP